MAPAPPLPSVGSSVCTPRFTAEANLFSSGTQASFGAVNFRGLAPRQCGFRRNAFWQVNHVVSTQNKIPVGILGATGIVGQRFLSLLADHPWFEPVWLAASERSAGHTYAEAARWRLKTPIPERFAKLPVSEATPHGCPARVIFAALDAGVAARLEPEFVAAGHVVISNSSALRMVPDVPLLVPEVNADHLNLIEQQPAWRERRACAVTNPNCSTVGLVMALAPLQQRFGLDKVSVVTMQAVSGAGYPGVSSLDILGNVVPFIKNEEDKLETEAQKILGILKDGQIHSSGFVVSAHCNRVPVEDGHMESVSVKLKTAASIEDVKQAMREFRGVPQQLNLPTAPLQPVVVTDAPDRPQPHFDVETGHGMTAVVGRVRPCPLFGIKFTVLSHNTIRGAAGAAVLNAELMYAQNRL